MSNYEKLKEVIQKANPEIMIWQHGCKVKDEDGEWTLIMDAKGGFDRQWHAFREGYGIDYLNLDHCEILGRPITLADVLLAKDTQHHIDTTQFIDEERITWLDTNAQNIVLKWNLKDDNLDNQSDGTKQLLIELLVKK